MKKVIFKIRKMNSKIQHFQINLKFQQMKTIILLDHNMNNQLTNVSTMIITNKHLTEVTTKILNNIKTE